MRVTDAAHIAIARTYKVKYDLSTGIAASDPGPF